MWAAETWPLMNYHRASSPTCMYYTSYTFRTPGADPAYAAHCIIAQAVFLHCSAEWISVHSMCAARSLYSMTGAQHGENIVRTRRPNSRFEYIGRADEARIAQRMG